MERVTLPAPKYPLYAATWMIILVTLSAIVPTHSANAVATSQASATKSALKWLSGDAKTDGSFGGFSQITAPAAAFAIWLNDSHSVRAAKSFSWLASQLDDSSSYAWGEADISGAMLHFLSASSNVALIQNQSDFSSLLSYQQSSGGFTGYTPPPDYLSIASSVDTDMALWGLVGTNHITSQQRTAAVNFLFSLQNRDGSFNLTSTKSSDPLNAFGPEPISVTALTVLSLKDASYGANENHVSKALGFLAQTVSQNFTSTSDLKGHVYGAALASLAFAEFGRDAQAAASISFIMNQQYADGSFRDIARGSPQNTLDTGWVAIALEQVQPGPLFSPFLSPFVFAGVIILVGVVSVLVVVAVYVLVRRRATKPTPLSGIKLTLSTY